MARAPSVLVTCTQPRADDIVADLAESGFNAIAMPALAVNILDNTKPDGVFDGMLVTSRHALLADLPSLPVITVGQETSAAAMKAGFTVIQSGNSNLADMDISAYKSLLYPCADEPSLIPPNASPWRVYKTVSNPHFQIPEEITTICIFSAKGAETVARLCSPDHDIICLSQAVAAVFENHPLDNLAVCATPRYDDMKKLIIKRHVRT